MKLIRKTTIVMVAVLVMIVGVFSTNMTQVKAATKTYKFSPCNVKKIKKSGKKLTIKLKDSTFQIGDNYTVIKSLKFKISKKCKWYKESFDRFSGGYTKSKSSYKAVRKAIMEDRSYYVKYGNFNNMGLSSIKIKNAKVVSVTYFSM